MMNDYECCDPITGKPRFTFFLFTFLVAITVLYIDIKLIPYNMNTTENNNKIYKPPKAIIVEIYHPDGNKTILLYKRINKKRIDEPTKKN